MTDASHPTDSDAPRPTDADAADSADPDGARHVDADAAPPDERVAPDPVSEGITRTDVPTRVPDGEDPAASCPRCGRPFRTERLRDLHVGEAHAADETERAAHEAADEAERDELFFYHIKVVVALGLLYAAFVMGYTIVLSAAG